METEISAALWAVWLWTQFPFFNVTTVALRIIVAVNSGTGGLSGQIAGWLDVVAGRESVHVCDGVVCDVQTAADELRELQRDMDDVERLRRELSTYFCEDEATFKLDDCIKTFSSFFDSFRKAVEVFYVDVMFLPRDAMLARYMP